MKLYRATLTYFDPKAKGTEFEMPIPVVRWFMVRNQAISMITKAKKAKKNAIGHEYYDGHYNVYDINLTKASILNFLNNLK